MEPLSLHFIHETLGARFGEVGGREVVLAYGDEAAEYPALRQGAALHDASYRQVVRLVGPDRQSFLHGMVTQDISGLAAGQATYAAMVTAKGAMVADARVLNRGEDLLMDLEPGTGDKVLEFLGRYLISEDAELQDATPDFGVLRLLGPRTGEVLARAAATEGPAALALREVQLGGQPALAVGTPSPWVGVDLVVPRAGLEAAWRALTQAGATPVGFGALERRRVEVGVPRYGQDMVDTTIPLEANLTHAISYNKGCYIGQEVIARATFRGHMNRKLAGLVLGEAEAAPGTPLRQGDKKVGWLTSVAHSPEHGGWVALGYVHRDLLEPGTELQLGDSPRTARVHALPF